MIKEDISDIAKWSKSEITAICDSCSLEKVMKMKLYSSYGYKDGEYLCKSCKRKKNNLEKWGVENVFQLDEVKEKIKKSNLEKWGVENPSQNNEIKEKIKKSFSKLNKDEVNKKRIKTVREKWGVDNISQLNKTKEKKEKTNFKNFGSHNKKSEIFRKEYFKIANDKNYIKYKTLLCTLCNPINKSQSGKEIKLYNFINSIYDGEITQNHRIENKEIDIYLPELNLGFEFNGVYWHSDLYKEKDFHLSKTKFFKEKGIHIFHIWEDEWDDKSDILKSQIKNLLKLNNKIGARKCKIKEIKDTKMARNFLNNNHIQGCVNSSLKLGLFHNEELVSIMSFDHFEGRNRMPDDNWNLNRFCNKLNINVIGGASKLLNYFIKNYEVKRIISYADISWSKGNLYETLGFKKIKESRYDYKYVIDGKRIHKSNFKKSNTGISESSLDLPKIYDCGKIKYEFKT